MKKQILLHLILITASITTALGQYTTFTYGLGGAGSIKIDTNTTTVTITLTCLSDRWTGIGFGGATMATTTDMFILNDTPDAVQSWTTVSDTVVSGFRTVVATRPLVSTGDYTFLNNYSFIQIIFAQGATTTLAYHGVNADHSSSQITRFVLALEDFSADAPSLYPNPAKGNFTVKTKTSIDKITIYSETGAVVKTVNLETPKDENQVNISDLATGRYIVELQNGSQKMYKNLMVE